jgi:hypothetical protein
MESVKRRNLVVTRVFDAPVEQVWAGRPEMVLHYVAIEGNLRGSATRELSERKGLWKTIQMKLKYAPWLKTGRMQ